MVTATTPSDGARDASLSDIPATVPALGRFMLSALFLLSGFAKLTSPAPFLDYIASVGLPMPQVALGIAILVEMVGGTMLVVGYKTKIVAYLMAGFTLVTAFIFHSNLANQTQFLFFFKNLAITGGLLQVSAFGAGRMSLDRR